MSSLTAKDSNKELSNWWWISSCKTWRWKNYIYSYGKKTLKEASISELKNYKFICMNTGIEWQSIDYHLNIENMLELSLQKVA